MYIKLIFQFLFLLVFTVSYGQQPRYTFKRFVRENDTTEFKVIYPKKNGFVRTYIVDHPQIWDIDDDSTTFIMGGVQALLCFEGQHKKGKKEGLFNVFLIDSADHSKRYRIWEQNYSNDKLNGRWNIYTLRGTLVSYQTFKNDSLHGVARQFWIDGRKIMTETEYFNGRNKFIGRNYYDNGNLKSEVPIEGGRINGSGKKYYEDGTIQEVAEFKDDVFDGVRKYFYPNGQVWIEQVYKQGKSWTVVANYTEDGQKRDAGTLRNGNGTIIFYDEDGTVREVREYVNGEQKE
jgi:antitoxin component YwqK of YwqJK toxin-antitoxin module